MTIFSYGFMQRAFLMAILISITTPLIGNIIVLKRFSTIGDSLSHSSLVGVAIGLVFRQNPVLYAVVTTIISALLIELIRSYFPRYQEISTSIMTSLTIGLVAILSSFVKNTTDLNSFLFGSMVTIETSELQFISVLSIIVILTSIFFYEELFYLTFDEESAMIAGINIQFVNLIFTVITATVIAIASKAIGALIISSLLVIPIACSMQVSTSYKSNIVLGIFFAFFFTMTGLLLSYYYNLKTGGTIILVGVTTLFLLLLYKKIRRSFQ